MFLWNVLDCFQQLMTFLVKTGSLYRKIKWTLVLLFSINLTYIFATNLSPFCTKIIITLMLRLLLFSLP